MDIKKYIENTKEKTKKAKLPALSTLTPVMPDGAAGIATFNSSFGSGISEELDPGDIQSLTDDIQNKAIEFMIDKGFNEDELQDVLNVEFIDNKNVFIIKIYADLTISSLRELSDTLYDIVVDYDEDAYFDISANNMISVELNMRKNLTEQFRYLDRIGMEQYNTNYDFEALYESTKTKLDTEDRVKLQKFIQTTDDPEEVNVYMKGLLMEEEKQLFEDTDITNNELSDLNSYIQSIQDILNGVVNEANKNGNDTTRSTADLALGALDDLRLYIEDLENNSDGATDNNLPPVDEYVNAFKENYQTEEEFKDATDMDYNESNISNIIFDWIVDDTTNNITDDEIASEMADKAADIIMRG